MKYKKVKQVKEPNSDNFHKFSCKIDIDEIIKSQIGILNIGGSCYMASIIQILIHLKQFLDYFEKYLAQIMTSVKGISVKDEASIIKNLNPNNDFIFQLMNH